MAGHEVQEPLSEESFQADQWRTCTQGHSLILDEKTRDIVIKTHKGLQKYSYRTSASLPDLLDKGYVLSDHWAFKGDGVMVATLTKESAAEGEFTFVLLFCDDIGKQLIGVTPVVCKDRVSHVEVFSCEFSRDRTILAYVVGILSGSDLHYLDCTTQVIFYDTVLWLPIRTFQGPSGIPPAFSFDPRCQRSRVVLLGLDHAPQIQIFCLNTGTCLRSRPVDFYDIDGETSLQMVHTDDGTGLIVQVIEYLGYGHEFLYRTYILDSDSLTLRSRTEASLASLCHNDCPPHTLPIFLPGCRKMALLSKGNKGKKSVKIHRMPLLPPLKVLCRQLLLEMGVKQQDFSKLNLSDELKSFMSLKPTQV